MTSLRGGPQCRVGAFAYLPGILTLVVAAGCGNDPKQPSGSAPGSNGSSGTVRADSGSRESLARFTEVAGASGVKFMYRDGQEAGHFAILESLGGGVALFDFDGDGSLDIFLPGGGRYGENKEILGLPGALYRNAGNRSFLDVTRAAGVDEAPYYSHGAAVGDYNNDGFPDLLVTGYGGLQFYRNHGDGTFVEAARNAALDDTLWSSSAAWGDLNGDGVLDLYVAHYVNWSFENHPICSSGSDDQREVCPPKRFEGLPDVLYFGVGDGTFRDGSAEARLMPVGKPPEVSMFDCDKGLGVLLGDIDLDGDLDIYVANDTVPKFLYRNRGNGVFDEIGGQSGAALSEMATSDGSMGLDLGDFNGDG
ncbi:MAG: VCBS repeat-containing protein, partial [Planctomycetia bacterium]|nr:VCBS repeat-containing protein [Planctomycetia bacterium]